MAERCVRAIRTYLYLPGGSVGFGARNRTFLRPVTEDGSSSGRGRGGTLVSSLFASSGCGSEIGDFDVLTVLAFGIKRREAEKIEGVLFLEDGFAITHRLAGKSSAVSIFLASTFVF